MPPVSITMVGRLTCELNGVERNNKTQDVVQHVEAVRDERKRADCITYSPRGRSEKSGADSVTGLTDYEFHEEEADIYDEQEGDARRAREREHDGRGPRAK
jgi:hypothetical protein